MSGLALFGLLMAACCISGSIGVLIGGMCAARERADLEARIMELERERER